MNEIDNQTIIVMHSITSILEEKMTLEFMETLNKGRIKTLEDIKRRRPPR